jgi:glycerate kinase
MQQPRRRGVLRYRFRVRILIAPDKFKGTLTAIKASEAMSLGARRAASELGIAIDVDECPVADGGEGTLDCVARARGITTFGGCAQVNPFDASVSITPRMLIDTPLQQIVVPEPIALDSFEYLVDDYIADHPLDQEGLTCLYGDDWDTPRDVMLESAEVIGLRLRASQEAMIESYSTEALGSMITRSLSRFTRRITIGLGGSGTVDGGFGMASKVGVRFVTERGVPAIPAPFFLSDVAEVIPLAHDHPLSKLEIIALCDVQNPLLGPTGAARMFGPQKGATPEQVERLEAGLEHLVRVCRRSGLSCDPDAPGAGAAGGLGFGLATFLGAKLVHGARFILDLLKFDERAAAADLVLTGEGMLDEQTAQGKACAAVARAAAHAGKPVIAIVGDTASDRETLKSVLAHAGVSFAAIHRLTDIAPSREHARSHAAEMLEEATCRAILGHLRAAGRDR